MDIDVEHIKHLKYKAKYTEAKKELEQLKGGVQVNPDMTNMFKKACQSVFVLNGKILGEDCRAIILALIDEFNLCAKGRKPVHAINISQHITIEGDNTAHICLRYCPEKECIEFNCCREIEKNVYRRDRIDRYLINLEPMENVITKSYVNDDYQSEILQKRKQIQADVISKVATKIQPNQNEQQSMETVKQLKDTIANINEKSKQIVEKKIDISKLKVDKPSVEISKTIEEIKKLPQLQGKEVVVSPPQEESSKEINLEKPKATLNVIEKIPNFGLSKFGTPTHEDVSLGNFITGTENIVKGTIETAADVVKKSSNTVSQAVVGMTNLINEFVQKGTEGVEKIATGTTGAIASTAKGDLEKGKKEMEQVLEGTVTNALKIVEDTTTNIAKVGENAIENIGKTGEDAVQNIGNIVKQKSTGGNKLGSLICNFDI